MGLSGGVENFSDMSPYLLTPGSLQKPCNQILLKLFQAECAPNAVFFRGSLNPTFNLGCDSCAGVCKEKGDTK